MIIMVLKSEIGLDRERKEQCNNCNIALSSIHVAST